MKKISFLFAVAAATTMAVSFSSCKKGCTDPEAVNYDEDVKKDDQSCTYPAVELTITSPVSSDVYHNGDTINITGTASYYQEMHGYELYILNKTTGDTVHHAHAHEHGASLTITSSWVVSNITAHSDMELNVDLILDHEGNTQSEKVAFMCMP